MNRNTKIILTALALISFSGNVLCQTYLTDKKYPLGKKDEIKFYSMTEEKAKEYEFDLWRKIADLALIPPKINTEPPSVYNYAQQDYVMALTNEITPKGRHWAAWIGNCDCPKAILLAAKNGGFKNQTFDTISDVEQNLCVAVLKLLDDKEKVKSLTGFGWVLNAISDILIAV